MHHHWYTNQARSFLMFLAIGIYILINTHQLPSRCHIMKPHLCQYESDCIAVEHLSQCSLHTIFDSHSLRGIDILLTSVAHFGCGVCVHYENCPVVIEVDTTISNTNNPFNSVSICIKRNRNEEASMEIIERFIRKYYREHNIEVPQK